jgi:S-adenosylmethionine-diacylglycerol 3-amino-3-carboxypropyl transferase
VTGPASEELRPSDALREAVHRFRPASLDGVRERIFTLAFKGLVYPQIWEDPEVDLKALAPKPGASLVAIASGGCNVLSYLTADPAAILAVDLNRAHVALTELKLAAIRQLPSHDLFFRFFGKADARANIAAYRRFLRHSVGRETRRYWDGRGLTGRRRITLFKRKIYRHGLLGRFIGASHLVPRLHGVNPRTMLKAESPAEQERIFETVLAPLFEKPLVRWLTSKKTSLYGLGIPPAQYEALALAGDGDMASVLCARLRRLACDFPLAENYFAWQAFGRGYPMAGDGPLPPYLRRVNYEAIRARRSRGGGAERAHGRAETPAARELQRLSPARRAGLDDRHAAPGSLGRDHPHRAARSARRFPHSGGANAAAGPRRCRHPRTLDLRGRAEPGAHRGGSLFDLWRTAYLPLRCVRSYQPGRSARRAESGDGIPLPGRRRTHRRNAGDQKELMDRVSTGTNATSDDGKYFLPAVPMRSWSPPAPRPRDRLRDRINLIAAARLPHSIVVSASISASAMLATRAPISALA